MGLVRHGSCDRRRRPARPTGTAYPNVTYNAEVPTAVQRNRSGPEQERRNLAVNTAGFSETRVWSGSAGRLWQSRFRDLQHLLSADGELLAAVLPH